MSRRLYSGVGQWKFQMTMVVSVLLLAVGVKGAGTPENIDELFLHRCYEYQQIVRPDLFARESKNCAELLRLFHQAYAFKDPCNVTVDSFDPFVLASRHDIHTQDRVLYWSGDVTPLVYEYSAVGQRFMTIRDILAGYAMRDIDQWCGQLHYPGIDTGSCSEWGFCPLQAQSSFWKAVSRSFAQEVQGSIHLMLNGSSGRAYDPNRTFGQHELPHLDSTRNPKIHVLLIHSVIEMDHIRETCDSGTLLDLRADVERKNIIFNCVEDPLDVLYLQCVSHLENAKCRNVIRSADPEF